MKAKRLEFDSLSNMRTRERCDEFDKNVQHVTDQIIGIEHTHTYRAPIDAVCASIKFYWLLSVRRLSLFRLIWTLVSVSSFFEFV